MRLFSLLFGVLLMSTQANAAPARWKLVIHGGAGVIEKSRMKPEKEKEVRAALDHALASGSAVLAAGGTALDAVEAAIRELEDNPNFNAGRGAVLTYDGTVELDASFMDGRRRAAGAVAGASATRHPISLARAVMEQSPHVFLSGKGADLFSRERGLEQVSNDWFILPERRRQLEQLKTKHLSALDVEYKYGTVGAVALDQTGHIAAGTSTGGMTGKRWGRIGDSPVIGAGTYADDRSAGISATGSGEYFIRAVAAHSVATRVQAGQKLSDALRSVVDDIGSIGGDGGLIAISKTGEVAWEFNTPGMYRGMADPDGRKVAIYSEAEER
jgi:beta-aspartyl-peptidase (threonine type)